MQEEISLAELSSKVTEAEAENGRSKADNQTLLKQLQAELERKGKMEERLIKLEADLKTNETNWEGKEKAHQGLASEIAGKSGQLKTLRSTLEYKDQQAAEQVLQTWKAELAALRKAFQEAEQAYLDLKTELEKNQALLKDQQERLVQATDAKDTAEKEYIAKCLACGFADQAAYQEALKTEAELKL